MGDNEEKGKFITELLRHINGMIVLSYFYFLINESIMICSLRNNLLK
jgi:hypothetical protein